LPARLFNELGTNRPLSSCLGNQLVGNLWELLNSNTTFGRFHPAANPLHYGQTKCWRWN